MNKKFPRAVPKPINDNPHWLDIHIIQQAAYFGMTVEQHAKFQRKVASMQEQAEREYWDY